MSIPECGAAGGRFPRGPDEAIRFCLTSTRVVFGLERQYRTRSIRFPLSVVVLLSWAFLGALRAGGGQQHAPTFNEDVAPIVFFKCVGCHRANKAAPMALTSFAEVRPWLRAIERKVAAKEMPPWLADHRFGRFRNDISLSSQEIQTIVDWARAGGPEGPGAAPRVPAFAEGWSHPSGRPPDIVLDMPNEVNVPDKGTLPTIGMLSALPESLRLVDHFAEAVQLLPGNTRVVHHSSLSMVVLPRGVTLGSAPAWPGGPVLNGAPVVIDLAKASMPTARAMTAAERFSPGGTSHLVFFFPGNDGFARFTGDTGKRISRDGHFEWGVHYTPTGRAEKDRHRVGIWLKRGPTIHEIVTMRVGDFHIVNGREIVLPSGIATNPGHAAFADIISSCEGRPCVVTKSPVPPIPAHARNWKITAISPFQNDVTLYVGYPHGHLRLQDMTYVLTYPDGHEEIILSVPRYNFNWQTRYEWERPIRAPAGSTIKVIGHYDNSAGNRGNPDPATEVAWGERSSDEMFNGFLDLSIDRFDVKPAAPEASSVSGQPQVPMVTVVGCVVRTADGRSLLASASTPKVSTILHADQGEIQTASPVEAGNRVFELIGTADFRPADELLEEGERRLFTQAETANGTGALRTGRKVAIKALLIDGGVRQALNLLSVQPVADTCKR